MKSGDKILLWGILTLTLFSGAAVVCPKLFPPKNQDTLAVIQQGDETLRRINLTKVHTPFALRVETPLGHYNILQVEPGRIRFLSADCPHKLCIASGWLSRPGEMALCLPHKTLIFLENPSFSEASVDAVAY